MGEETFIKQYHRDCRKCIKEVTNLKHSPSLSLNLSLILTGLKKLEIGRGK